MKKAGKRNVLNVAPGLCPEIITILWNKQFRQQKGHYFDRIEGVLLNKFSSLFFFLVFLLGKNVSLKRRISSQLDA